MKLSPTELQIVAYLANMSNLKRKNETTKKVIQAQLNLKQVILDRSIKNLIKQNLITLDDGNYTLSKVEGDSFTTIPISMLQHLQNMSSSTIRLYMYLSQIQGGDDEATIPTAKIIKATGINRRLVAYSIQSLIGWGYIIKEGDVYKCRDNVIPSFAKEKIEVVEEERISA
jgi:hypothetical protein